METPLELRYSAEHQWVRGADGGVVRVGITDFAQDQLGEIVYVDLPGVGATVARGAAYGVVESVKAVSDLIAPLSGEVLSRNEVLDGSPGTVNASPYEQGWMLRLRLSDPDEMAVLLDAAWYQSSTGESCRFSRGSDT